MNTVIQTIITPHKRAALFCVVVASVSMSLFFFASSAQAAVTINNYTGFETQGTQEATSTSGTISFETSGSQRTGNAALWLNSEANIYNLAWYNSNASLSGGGTTDAGGNYIIGFAYRYNTAPSATSSLLKIIDNTGSNVIMEVRVATTGALLLVDASSSTLSTSTVLTSNTWNYIEIYAGLNATSSWEWFLNNTSVGSGTGADFSDGSTFGGGGSMLRIAGYGGSVQLADDFYILSGATSANDRFGDAEIIKFQNAVNSTTPTAGLLGTAGAVANSGNWSTSGETPGNDANFVTYSTTNSGGTVDLTGPSSTTTIDGSANIRSVKGIWRLARGTGAATTHSLGLGDSGDGNSAASYTVTLTTSAANYIVIKTSDLPTHAQAIRQGGWTGGAQDLLIYEMWSMVLHVPSNAIRITGTLYSDEGSTQITGGATIKAVIGTSTVSTVSSSTDTGAGSFSLTIPGGSGKTMAAGTPIVVYTDGGSNRAVTVTKVAGENLNISSLPLYKDRIIVTHEATLGTSTTIADMGVYDSDNDSDIGYNATTASAGLVVYSPNELHVATGKNFAPGGTTTIYGNASTSLTDGSLHLTATSTFFQVATTTIGGSLYASTSASLVSSSTSHGLLFNATTTGKVVDGGGAYTQYGQITFNGVGGGWTFRDNASTTNLLIATGTVLAPNVLEIAGNYTNTGTFSNNGGSFLFTAPTSTITGTVTGSSALGNVTRTQSSDGSAWTTTDTDISNAGYALGYGSGRFVAVGGSTTVPCRYSSDGRTWTSCSGLTANQWIGVLYAGGQFVALAGSSTSATNAIATSPDGITWTPRNGPAVVQWGDFTYGNGRYVAVSNNSYYGGFRYGMTSTDGVTWSLIALPNASWNSIAFGNGRFVIAEYGVSGYVAMSTDGQNWSMYTSPWGFSNVGVRYANGIFFNSAAYVSLDGVNWTKRTAPGASAIYYMPDMRFFLGTISNLAQVKISPDMNTWTTYTVPNTANWYYAVSGNNTLVVNSSQGASMYANPRGALIFPTSGASTTNLTIASSTQANLPQTLTIGGSFANNSTTTAMASTTYFTGASSTMMYTISGNLTGSSSLGTTTVSGRYWFNGDASTTDLTIANNGVLNAGGRLSISGNYTNASGTFESFGSSTRFTGTGKTWSGTGTTTFTQTFIDGSITAAAPATTSNFTISSGASFTASSTLTMGGNFTNSGTWTNASGTLIIAGASSSLPATLTGASALGNTIVRPSSSGGGSTTSYPGYVTSMNGGTFGNGQFVGVQWAYGGGAVTSPDGVNWTSRGGIGLGYWQSVTYGNGIFVAVSDFNGGDRVATSPDGINWTTRTQSVGNPWKSVTYGNGLFVAVAASTTSTNNVMTSPDGITWTTRIGAEANNWYVVTFGNGLFVAVANTGTGNRVMTSPDGITWTARSAAGNDDGWQGITYGNGLFVAVGGGPDYVMTSPDGITWTARTAAEANSWNGVAFGGGLFAAAAATGNNRVMTSPDGITWTARPVSSSTPWGGSMMYGNGTFATFAIGGFDGVLSLRQGSFSFLNNASTTDFTVASNATVALPTLMTIGGDFTTSGTTTQSSGTTTFSGTGKTISGTGTTTFANMQVNGTYTSSAQNASTTNFFVGSSGSFAKTGNLQVMNRFLNSGTYTASAGTTTFPGSNNTLEGNLSGTSNLGNININGSAVMSNNASTSNVYIDTFGSLTAPALLSISGNYNNTSNGFTAGSGTTTFNGTSQQTATGTMTGLSAFKNLEITNTSGTGSSTKSVIFGARASTTNNLMMQASTSAAFLAGPTATSSFQNLVVNGVAGSPVWLRSATEGTQWGISVPGTRTITYARIKDSNACAGGTDISLDATSVDNGNNTCWSFVAELILSGTLFSDQGTTQITTGKNIKIAVATSTVSVFSTTTDSGVGTWTITIPAGHTVNAGVPITIWVDGDASTRAVTVTKAKNTQSISGVPLYKDHVIITHEGTGTSTTFADMAFYDYDDDNDIQFTATTSSSTIAAGNALYVYPGKTFSASGTLSIHANASTSVYDGSLLLGASATYIAGGLTSLGGSLRASSTATYTAHSSGTLFMATTTGKVVDWATTTGSIGSTTFNGTGGGWTIANNATTSNLSIVTGTVVGPTSLTIQGNYQNSGTFTAGATTTFSSSSAQTLAGVMTESSAFQNIQFSGAGTKTFSANASTTDLTVNAGSIAALPSLMTVAGTFTNNGTTTQSSGTTTFSGTGKSMSGSGTTTFANMQVTGTYTSSSLTQATTTDLRVETGGRLMLPTQSFVIAGDYVNNGSTTQQSGTTTLSGTLKSMSGTGTTTFAHVRVSGTIATSTLTQATTTDLRIESGAQFITPVQQLVVTGNYYNAGTSTQQTGTTTFAGTSKTISGTLTGASTLGTTTVTGSYTMSNNASTTHLTIASGGTLTAPSLLSISGNYANSGTFTAGTGTTTLSGTSLQTATGTMIGSSAFTNLEIINTSGTGSSTKSVTFGAPASTTNNLTMQASTSAAFLAGPTATSSFQNLVLNGSSASSPVWIRSATEGTQWGLKVPGTRSLTYARVKDSNACSGGTDIDASSGNNSNKGNNSCWSFVGGVTTVAYLTSGTTWTVPSDWNSSNNTIEVIGAGANGAPGDLPTGGRGGGGGGYSKISNLSLTPNATAYVSIGAAGATGGDTWFNGTANTAPASTADGALAKGGTGTAGGAAASGVGSTKYSGGAPGTMSSGNGGSGGGGAAGPHADGANGGTSNNTGGSGGGAADGGSNGSSPSGSTGGSGGTAANNGGAGGRGGDSSFGSGSSGGAGTTFSALYGAGGGGGGGGYGSLFDDGGQGGNATGYGGGGGGGGGAEQTTGGYGGTGYQGLIVVTYTTAGAGSAPTMSSAADQTFDMLYSNAAMSPITITEDESTPTITAANDIRIVIATSSANMRWYTFFIQPEFSGTASGKVSTEVTQEGGGSVLVIDVTEDFAAGDTLTLSSLSYQSFATATPPVQALALRTGGASDTSNDATDSKTVTIKGYGSIGNHSGGQVSDALSFPTDTGVPLYAFKISASGEYASTTALTFDLLGIDGIVTADLTNAKIYRDYNGNHVVDGGDDQVGGSGTVAITGQSGTISFSTPFLATTTRDYLLVADTANIRPGDMFTVSLSASDVTLMGSTSLAAITPSGTVSSVQHIRSGGGAGPSSVGGEAPAGAGIVTGGDEEGGGGIDAQEDGSPLNPEPGFNPPSSTGSLYNEWTNGANAYASDNVKATVVNGGRQSYGDFSFNIPSGNVIDGIEVQLEAGRFLGVNSISAGLSWDGDTSLTSTKSTGSLTSLDAVYVLGGPSDTWGRTWTTSELSNANFRLRLVGSVTSATTLDAIQVKVYHHTAGGGQGGGGGIVRRPTETLLAGTSYRSDDQVTALLHEAFTKLQYLLSALK